MFYLTGKYVFHKNQNYWPSCVLSQNLCYNKYIQVDKGSFHLVKFSDKNINTVSDLYDSRNLFVNWEILKERYKSQE